MNEKENMEELNYGGDIMLCKGCGKEIDKDICPNCRTDNHDYTIDWIKAVANIIYV